MGQVTHLAVGMLDRWHTEPMSGLGEELQAINPVTGLVSLFRYLRIEGAITQGLGYIFTPASVAPALNIVGAAVDQANDLLGQIVAFANFDPAKSSPGTPSASVPRFAYFAIGGSAQARLLTLCAPNAFLYTVATGANSGSLDDDATTALKLTNTFYYGTAIGASATLANIRRVDGTFEIGV